jgi:hypothetical protein
LGFDKNSWVFSDFDFEKAGQTKIQSIFKEKMSKKARN